MKPDLIRIAVKDLDHHGQICLIEKGVGFCSSTPPIDMPTSEDPKIPKRYLFCCSQEPDERFNPGRHEHERHKRIGADWLTWPGMFAAIPTHGGISQAVFYMEIFQR